MRTNCMFRNNSPQQLEIEDESHSPWQTNLHHSYQVRNVYHPRWLSENSNHPPHRVVVEGVVVTLTNWGPFKFHQMLGNSSLRKSTLRDFVSRRKYSWSRLVRRVLIFHPNWILLPLWSIWTHQVLNNGEIVGTYTYIMNICSSMTCFHIHGPTDV